MRGWGHKDRFVDVRGLRMHYVDYGGEGDVVIALHGLVQTARSFDSIAPLLVPRHRLIALDIRGRGDSDWDPDGRYRMDHYFRDLKAFLSELELDRVSLIGSSLGGWIAMMFATAYPDRVRRLVLNDCAIDGDPGGLLRVALHSRNAPEAFETFERAVEWFVDGRPWLLNLGKKTLAAWVTPNLRFDEDGRWRLKCDPKAIRMASEIATRIAAADPVENELAWEQSRRLTMPVLLLHGALSDVISEGTITRLVSMLPDARKVTIPGAGHTPTLIEKESQEALHDFFGGAPDSGVFRAAQEGESSGL